MVNTSWGSYDSIRDGVYSIHHAEPGNVFLHVPASRDLALTTGGDVLVATVGRCRFTL